MKYVRLLRFNIGRHSDTVDPVLGLYSDIDMTKPFKNFTDFLGESYNFRKTIGNQTQETYLSNVSRMEGVLVIDKHHKILRVGSAPDIMTLFTKVMVVDGCWRLVIKLDEFDHYNENTWTLVSGVDSDGNNLDGIRLPIMLGRQYVFQGFDQVNQNEVHDSDSKSHGLILNSFGYGSTPTTESGIVSLGSHALSWTTSEFNSATDGLEWNSDGTINNNKDRVWFAINHLTDKFDTSIDGYFMNNVSNLSYTHQKFYDFEIVDPYESMEGGVAYVEDYQQGHRPYGLVNDLGNIHPNRYRIGWTNYLLEKISDFNPWED